MGQNFNTAGEITYRGRGLIKKRLLKRGMYPLCAAKYGQPFTQPKNMTLTGNWRRYHSFPRVEAPLAEGITPPGQKIAHTDVTATLQQFGDYAEITDVAWDTHEDKLPMETVDLCSEQMGETLEVVTIGVLKSGTNVYYANNAASRAYVNSPPVAGDFLRIERALYTNKAKMITRRIGASQMVSTEPVDPGFIVFGHTNLKADLENVDGWTPVGNYADSSKSVDKAEKGAIGVFRFLLTPLFEPWLAAATSATGQTYLSSNAVPSSDLAPDVYPMIIVAADAYGVVRMQGMNSVKPAVVPPKPIQGDELGQRGFISWKTYFAAVLLNSAWCARYECAATALP